jgi:hypothetical protein
MNSLFGPGLPTARCSPTMKDSNDDDSVIQDLIEHSIGKATDVRPTKLFINGQAKFRPLLQLWQSLVNAFQQSPAESGLALFAPSASVFEVLLRRLAKDELVRHSSPSSRRRDSSQLEPSLGLASKSAKRQSSSARCSAVRGISPCSSQALCQRACAIFNRSAALSFAASAISVSADMRILLVPDFTIILRTRPCHGRANR